MPSWIQSASDFASFLVMRDEGDLPEFLDKFRFMTPQIAGDAHAISRVAFELCEDKKKEGEGRLSILTNDAEYCSVGNRLLALKWSMLHSTFS